MTRVLKVHLWHNCTVDLNDNSISMKFTEAIKASCRRQVSIKQKVYQIIKDVIDYEYPVVAK